MRSRALTLLFILGAAWRASGQTRYLGKEIGELSRLQHGVRGQLFAVDSRTIYLHDFHYDGEGPSAYFYVGTSKSPSASGGLRLRDERGGTGPLRKYRGESITLALPEGHTLKDLRWFSVWCDEYSVNFGDVSIPASLEYPRPAKVGALRGVHGVGSDPVVVVDSQTLLIPNFSYDGEAPDAKFWVGRGDKPSPQGIRIPDENGKETPLRKYDKKTIVLTLPGELTVFDIGHFAVWCEAFTVNFGHVVLPRAKLEHVPPSLKMLGVSPQSKLNCEVLYDELAFEVRWAVAGDSIVIQLVAKLEDGEYMSFGVSGDPEHSQMVGGDVAVAWVERGSQRGHAEDYYLDAKSQCAGVRGSCPDHRLVDNTNSVRPLNSAVVSGYSIVTYQRSLRAADELDLDIVTNRSQPVIWAIGPLNSRQEVSYHHHYTKGDKFLEFGRAPLWNCPMPEADDQRRPPPRPAQPQQHTRNESVIVPKPVPTPRPAERVRAWDIPAIQCYEPPDGVFYAQMGPTGGKQGYPAITGHVGWGISWYINGLLIPEINVVRGRRYTFVAEGGSDPAAPASYHPFYITNDPVGGYFHKSPAEREGIEIYAGVRRSRNGDLTPTGVGRLCSWTPDASGPEADEYPSFGAYQRSLTLVCEEGSPGVVTWTPDKNTPDTVYYQCFTHRHLGWKINVLDECDEVEGEESRLVSQVLPPGDLVSDESVQVPSRLPNVLDDRRKLQKIINTKPNYNDFSSDKDEGLSGDQSDPQEQPLTRAELKEVIHAVENLDSQLRLDARNRSQDPHQYQVHEDIKELLGPQPFREGDEYSLDGRLTDNYLLTASQQPLTLQSVLRPGQGHRPSGPIRPFRRPMPPEIVMRRPPPPALFPSTFPKGNGNNYPLSMPAPGHHGMQKKQPSFKNPSNRLPSVMNRYPQQHMPQMPRIQQHNIPPMKAMPTMPYPKPAFNPGPPKQHQKFPSGPPPTIIMAKPFTTQSQTLSLGQTDIIANQVVKSQITLPGGASDAVAQHSAPQPYVNSPEQIILGKPMEHPVPLDQQMIPTRPQPSRTPPTPTYHQPPTKRYNVKVESQPSANTIISSDFVGESVDSSTLVPAVNTGFKPDSIVVESGFKPIIREPLMAAEDRIAGYEESSNRREDTDVEDEYEEAPQYVANHAFSSDKITESFEPMFIPSPPDHLLPTNDRTKEIFPSNHAKEDRPHPVFVKTGNELNALFGKNNMDKQIPSDLVMDSDRVSPHYLPPDPKLPKQHSQKLSAGDQTTFTTYDGKTVSAATLTSVPENMPSTPNKLFSSKLPANTELLLKTPQFGPFKGEIPPPVAAHIAQDTTKTTERSPVQSAKTTQLKPVTRKDAKIGGSEDFENRKDKNIPEGPGGYDEYDNPVGDNRKKRETKATPFQVGSTSVVNLASPSQVDFEPAVSSHTALRWTKHIVLLMLCLHLY